MSTTELPPNADAGELKKFSDLAHRWWDPDGEFRPLHAINPLRLEWIAQRAGGLAGKRIVDVGCGGGILADAMARAGAAWVDGIDLAEKSLSVAQLHALEAQTPNIAYRCISAEAMAQEAPGSFDVVTCMEMLEHVPDPAAIVRACAEMAKPGGWLFFSTLNRNPKSWLFAIVGAEYLLRILPRGTHDWARFITPAELAAWLRQAGLELQASKGLSYNPFMGRYSLSDDTSVNYMLAARKPA
ncbi:bifunctional 2-polyprenyl-6-hydroxyphenol methylase/3-demethylubiquinol 3-O-methyltransferase UbiG [Allofranklinella schreckenbergeri]|uniref:Ubiquinone biosynthesis O-methyltransferase n=1 Tax=Allofranklinella schreckenbergeri TaxID=1076744 RepID=A0A3M6Q0X8_9BURK|nr:bifunctional 2-polyprenyl-6-hydroxyphenol methylase/3-demethylubiquinol 3-O-methyltransferase UbiG [Allofranklinella schreckenbergeri]RMW96083.1 bifunctional 2-polyprenyl-6-hydroxyphenol methylase/3-demethylubiquinol 3-O-methyltransferase UbiG [Allofranklinella schreckenbergeri]RMW96933.1 bifunctional 2-polyprenyl-6-hydroxyphenol methylase/3-demethylubiquinol 3-O-methyltransferase UbiG [Allofranklinella schreckenbergeri]RRD40146.1 bifunctional 2-polyprenyl-6-hydroxyphenol methylase/3-demethyl